MPLNEGYIGLTIDDFLKQLDRVGRATNVGIGFLFFGFAMNLVCGGIVFFIERTTSHVSGVMNYKSQLVLFLAAFVYMIQAVITHSYPVESNIIKYMYWLMSTPIIVIQLCELLDGLHVITWVVVLDILTIVFGFLAWIVGASVSLKWFLYGTSCVCASVMFSIVGVMFLMNHKLLESSGYLKEQKLYKIIAAIYFTGWSLFPIVWLLGFEGFGLINEDFLCIAHVILDFFCKDLTEILIAYVTHSLNLRLAEMADEEPSLDKEKEHANTPVRLSMANMVVARVAQQASMMDLMLPFPQSNNQLQTTYSNIRRRSIDVGSPSAKTSNFNMNSPALGYMRRGSAAASRTQSQQIPTINVIDSNVEENEDDSTSSNKQSQSDQLAAMRAKNVAQNVTTPQTILRKLLGPVTSSSAPSSQPGSSSSLEEGPSLKNSFIHKKKVAIISQENVIREMDEVSLEMDEVSLEQPAPPTLSKDAEDMVNAQKEMLEKELKALKLKETERDISVKVLERKYAETVQKNTSLGEEIKKLRASINNGDNQTVDGLSLREAYNKLQQEYDKMKKERDHVQELIEKMAEEKVDSEVLRENTSVSHELAEVSKKAKDTELELRKEVDELKAKLAQAFSMQVNKDQEVKMKQLEDTLKNKEDSLNEERKRVRSMSIDRERDIERSVKLQAEVDSLRTQIQNLNSKCAKDIENAKEALKAEYEVKMQKLNETLEQLEKELKSTKQALEQEMKKPSAPAVATDEEMESLRENHNMALEMLRESTDRVKELESDMNDMKEAYRQQIQDLVKKLNTKSQNTA